MSVMPKPYPKEFRDDVVAVARTGEAPLTQIKQSAEARDLKKRNRLLEQENEVLRRAAAYLSQANLPGK
jgi:transposase